MPITAGYANVVISRSSLLITKTEQRPAKSRACGRPQKHSDVTVEATSVVRQVSHLSLRLGGLYQKSNPTMARKF